MSGHISDIRTLTSRLWQRNSQMCGLLASVVRVSEALPGALTLATVILANSNGVAVL